MVFEEIGARLARDGDSVTVYTTDAWDLERFWRADKRAVPLENEMYRGVFIQRFAVEYLPLSRITFPALKRSMAFLAKQQFDATPLLFALARYTPYVPSLDRALDLSAESFHLVHTANISLDSCVYAAYRFARRKKIPFLITPFLHLGEEEDAHVRRYYTMPHQRQMLQRADAVIAMTPREAEALAQYGVSRHKIHIIGAGVEPTTLAGGAGERFRAQHNITAPIVTYIGTAAYDKGTVHLVEAMRQVWQSQEAVLVLAGSQLSSFETFFAGQPEVVKERTRQLGFISAQEKRDLLAATDVFVMPSRTDSFGIVYLEAWLYNKPVIGAFAGGVPDVIDHEQNGFMIKFGDTTMLAARILQLLSDPELAARLGQNGHLKVLRRMTWDHQYAQVKALYESLVSK
ncbi:MAG TPA: glycosyltransferase family 4 protein [Anaerolineae bacterium]|nr:glycosyltransferase family 4 protein [Anaerolineae bacterium]